MANDGVLGGVSVAALTSGADPSIDGDLADVLLVTVTERRTKEEIDRFAEKLAEVLK